MSSSDDAGVNSRFVSICRDGFGGFEVAIAFDGKAELAADGLQFDEAHIAELLGPHPGPSPSGPACVGSKRLLPF